MTNRVFKKARVGRTTPLPPDIIPLIAVRILASDPIDLISFRAVCCLFRSCSPNPCTLASLHRPRQWIMLSDGCSDLSMPRSFLNLSSGRSIKISLPDLYGHTILTSVDGLLVLRHHETFLVRLLNPFTRLMVDLPPLMTSSDCSFSCDSHDVIFPSRCLPLVCAAISFSEDNIHNPTVMICFQKSDEVIVCKPGDQQWVSIRDLYGFHYNVIFFQGKFFATNYRGKVCTIHLEQDKITKIGSLDVAEPDWICNSEYRSYLVELNSTLLLVRKCFYRGPNNTFIEVYQVDLENKTLNLIRNIGDHALFVGATRTLSVSSKDFPCTVPNSIYVGTSWLVRLEDYSCEPISDNAVIRDGLKIIKTSERPYTLADHLITYCSSIQWARGLMHHELCKIPRGRKQFVWGITRDDDLF